MLSQTAVYSIKAVLYLAENGNGKPARVDDIAAALDVPRNYLSKILHTMARAGLLDSTRGPRGGFRLKADPSKLTLQQLVVFVDGTVDGSSCLLSRERCDNERPCAVHPRWKDVSSGIMTFFRETTVRDLATRGPATSG